MPKNFLTTRNTILSTVGVCPFLIPAGGVKSCSCRGLFQHSPCGWWAGGMQSQPSFCQVSLQWVGGRWGWLEHWPRYSHSCLGGADMEFNHKNTFSPQSAQWAASAWLAGLSCSLWLSQGCGDANRSWAHSRSSQGSWFALSLLSAFPVCSGAVPRSGAWCHCAGTQHRDLFPQIIYYLTSAFC